MPQQLPDLAKGLTDTFSEFRGMLFQEEPLSPDQVTSFSQKFQDQFGKSITEVTDTKNLGQAISKARGNLKNIIKELLPSKFKDIKQIKNAGKRVVDEFGKGIHGAITDENVDVTGNIADVFTKTFSEKLNRKVTKSLKTQQTAEQVASLVVGSINFIFKIIKRALQNKKIQGQISSIASNAFSSFTTASGGQRKGGPIGFASGGQVKGQGGIDQISAMLSRGEFVVRREAVNAQTLPFLKQLNENKGMRTGGSVGNTASSVPADAQGNQRDVNINITAVDASSFQALVENNPEVITNQILKDLDKNGRTRKAFQQKVDR